MSHTSDPKHYMSVLKARAVTGIEPDIKNSCATRFGLVHDVEDRLQDLIERERERERDRETERQRDRERERERAPPKGVILILLNVEF